MRKLYSSLLFVLFASLVTPVKGQSTFGSEYDLINLLCQEWQMSHGEVDGLKIQGVEAIKDRFVFYHNKTYTLLKSDSTVVRGIWKYNKLRKRFEMRLQEAGQIQAVIEEIGPDRFVLLPVLQSEPSRKVFNRFRYYYTRMQ